MKGTPFSSLWIVGIAIRSPIYEKLLSFYQEPQTIRFDCPIRHDFGDGDGLDFIPAFFVFGFSGLLPSSTPTHPLFIPICGYGFITYIWRGGRAPHGSRQRSRSFGEWLGMELCEYREDTNKRRSHGMDKRYSYHGEGEKPLECVGWWFILMSSGILWFGVYLAILWLWK